MVINKHCPKREITLKLNEKIIKNLDDVVGIKDILINKIIKLQIYL